MEIKYNHKEYQKNYQEKYKIENKDKLNEYSKKYYEQNKDKILETVVCDLCGGKYNNSSKAKHIRTKKHQKKV